MVQKVRESLEISVKVNFRDKNFVITLNFRDSMLPRPFFSERAIYRAGGNGTAGTAMAVPVFEGEKWRRLDSNLRVRYRMASPSGSP